MASHLVNQHQQSSFATPVNGDAGDATVVLGNDNATVASYNSHDADATIHVQDSSAAVFGATAAGVAGRKWMTNDTGGVYLYFDTGSVWAEVNYLRNTGGTITSTTAPQLTIAYDGSNKLDISVSSAGAVTLNATGASAGFTFSDVVIGKDGSAAAPSFVFSSDLTTGLYRSASETIGFATGGGLRASLNGSAFTTASGVAIVVTAAGITATTGTFGTTAAATGQLRIPNATFLNARNAADSGDIGLIGTVSDDVSIGVGATAVTFPVRIGLFGAATAGSGSDVYLGGTTQTTIGANGGASALTANPLGYLIAYKGSTKIVIPYYNG